MSDAREILITRSREIRAMQRYISSLDRGDVKVASNAVSRAEESIVVNSIKAAFIMMLYNLAEAIVVSTIHEVFRRVNTEDLGYDQVALEIREFWLKQRMARLRLGKPETHMQLVKEAIESALGKEGLGFFKPEEIRKGYAGNVDAKVIREIAAQFSVVLTPRKSTRGGEKLLAIKNNRNDLGHGIFSFSEVGATQTADDLRDTSVRVRRFLSDAVLSFDRYLSNRGYAAV